MILAPKACSIVIGKLSMLHLSILEYCQLIASVLDILNLHAFELRLSLHFNLYIVILKYHSTTLKSFTYVSPGSAIVRRYIYRSFLGFSRLLCPLDLLGDLFFTILFLYTCYYYSLWIRCVEFFHRFVVVIDQ